MKAFGRQFETKLSKEFIKEIFSVNVFCLLIYILLLLLFFFFWLHWIFVAVCGLFFSCEQ